MSESPASGGSLDDAAIIEQSRHAPERFAALFDRHASEIHRYIRRRLGEQSADDLVAETFLTAFRKRLQYSSERRDARPWLYGIATNLVGLHRRSEARKYRALARHGVDPITDGAGSGNHADDVTAHVTAQSTRREIAQALQRLSQGDRDVLLLFGWEELSYEEISTALNIPVGTVRSRLNRARRKVRGALRETNSGRAVEELSYG